MQRLLTTGETSPRANPRKQSAFELATAAEAVEGEGASGFPRRGAPEAASGAAPEAAPLRHGYTYLGRVSFVGAARGVPLVELGSGAAAVPLAAERRAGDEVPQHHTVLVTSEGHRFTKRLPTDPNDPELAEALQAADFSGAPPVVGPLSERRRRRLGRRLAQAQGGQPAASIGAVATDTNLSCDGCPNTDTRTEVLDTTRYPYSAVGELTGELKGTTRGLECTGTLIGPKHVVTAAHCVFDINDSHQYVSALNFAAGQNGNLQPFGQAAWATLRVVDQFTQQPTYTPTAMNYDFALITLKAPVDGPGWLGLMAGSGDPTYSLTTSGYPGEKPTGTMWMSTCSGVAINFGGNQGVFVDIDQCQSQACANVMTHTCLSTNGQSGSSMWDSSNAIRAVLTGKVATSDGANMNVGTKLDAYVYNTLAAWYNEDMKAAGSNATLPAAPSGPQPPAPASARPRFLGLAVDWTDPAFITVVALLVLAGVLVGGGAVYTLCRLCECAMRPRAKPPLPPPAAITANGRQPQQQFMTAAPAYGSSNGTHGPPGRGASGGQPQGVTYDSRTGMFLLNGQPYGRMQGGA
ncbi:hypothetical protein WJX81_000661 [Elliptochloris bilobata]|uniref:Serine protease n=1 Tax=Elliptochloris bilobata TaxID=381761 RepID=A0AAW1RYK9_9CHLO